MTRETLAVGILLMTVPGIWFATWLNNRKKKPKPPYYDVPVPKDVWREGEGVEVDGQHRRKEGCKPRSAAKRKNAQRTGKP